MKRSLLLLILLALLSGFGLWLVLRSDPHQDALRVRELAARGLADYLTRNYPGRHALVISNPFTRKKGVAREILEMERAGLHGLKEGLGTKVTVEAIVFPELKPEAQTNPRAVFIDAETTTPLSFLVAEEAFDQLAAQHPNCELIVSLIGLPAALERVRCWRANEKPKFALLLPDLRFVGDATAVQRAIQSGKLVAFVLNRPGAPDSEAAADRDFRAEFAKRFLLVTEENIDQMLQTYPQLFPAN